MSLHLDILNEPKGLPFVNDQLRIPLNNATVVSELGERKYEFIVS